MLRGIYRLIALILITVIGGLIVTFVMYSTLPYRHTQTQNLILVGHWIEKVQPQVKEFSTSESLDLAVYGASSFTVRLTKSYNRVITVSSPH